MHIVYYIKSNQTFENVGLDCTEPFFIKDKRNAHKGYVLLFTFIVTRAMHLELSTNVSATVLILTIRRFSLGRGVPKLFVSDNFKSFELTELKRFLVKRCRFNLKKSP